MRGLVFVLFAVSLSSCLVSKKKFDAQKALADRCDSTLADCADKLKKAEADLSLLKGSESELRSKLEKENAENESLTTKHTKLSNDFEQSQKQYEDLKARMEALGKNSMSEKESLSSALKQKEKDLAEREKRIHELESLMAKKDEAVSSLKKKIADALTGFNSNELTVTQKDGKVYVSLSDKLLFKSGSFTVDEKGKQAIVKVAEVLNKQTEIGIVIEGHTDSKQYVNPKGEIKNNWDLSVMRAAMVTSIMIAEGKVEAGRITPSGHAEFFPVESNETAEGRSKNRRIEIVLSPDLKEIFKNFRQYESLSIISSPTMARLDQVTDDHEMGFFDHIDVMRKHIMRSVLAIVIFAGVALVNTRWVFDAFLFGPVKSDFITYRLLCKFSMWVRPILCNVSSVFCPEEGLCMKDFKITFLNTELFGQFISQIQICIVLGIVAAFPYIIFEIWRFVRPALSAEESKKSSRIIIFSSLFFFVGILFAYFLVIPFSLSFANSYVISSQIENRFTFDNYVGFITMMMLGSGLVFELPMIVYFLAKMGLLTATFMRTYRRHAIVVILIVAAVITPSPDMFTMMVVAVPIYFLYELSILLANRINP